MTTALARRSWRELTRHRARSALTVATLAAAVAGVWLFAVPRQLDAAMNERVAHDRIHDVMLFPDGIRLDDDDLPALRAVPNVAGLDARITYFTRMQVGDRSQDVWVVGVTDFVDQQVNVVGVDAGRVPVAGGGSVEVLVDPQNDRSGRHAGAVGDTVSIRAADGSMQPATVVGRGGSVVFSNTVVEGAAVLYAPAEAVWDLTGTDRFFRIEFRVSDRSDAATTGAIDAVRDDLARIDPGVRYDTLVELRPRGEWPGADDFDNYLVLFRVIVAVSFVSAVVLVATTMSTMVREQTGEIGIMKALGATRHRLVATFAGTVAVLGSVGTAVGVAIGVPLSNLLTGFLSREFIGVVVGWRFSWMALGLSVALGLVGSLLAALPAVLRGARIPVREAIDAPGIGAGFGQSAVDRVLGRVRRMPRPAQLGVRNAARRKGRTVATAVQVALAIGTLLGFTALVVTFVEVSEQSRSAEGGDIELYASGNGRPVDTAAAELVAGIDGVGEVQPVVGVSVLVGDTDTFVWGLPPDPVYRYELDEGRWFTSAENDGRARVAVVGPALAAVHDLAVGDHVRVESEDQGVTLEVVGIDSVMVGDGRALFAPIDTMLALTGRSGASWFWITTTSDDHGDIDHVATEIGAVLDGRGYGFGLDVRYVERAAERTQDRTIIALILALGIPIVAIGMIGLVSTMATAVMERTREIGVLRSLGARSRDIRRIFRAEAMTVVALGWLAGIGVGVLVARIILRAMNDAFDVSFDLRFPLWSVAVALVVAVVAANVVLARSLRRASRIPAGSAIRYQ